MTKQLYPEQQTARYGINSMLNAGISPVYISPCGTGKTFTSCAIIKDRISLGKRIYVLVPQIEIHGQWIDELVEAGINPGWITDEGMKGKNRSVYVCMYQSLINLLPFIPESLYPDEIIIDETQHMLCKSIKDICTFFPDATRLGLTATLYHNSGETFRPWFTETIQTITKRQAIEKGYITEPLLIVPEDYLANADIPDLGKEYDMELQAAALGKTRIIGDMIEYYESLFFGRPVIVPCATYLQAEQITKMFNDAGWKFEHLHSESMPKHERKRILKAVANQTINGICTVGIGVEGLSIKGLWGVMWACRTKSPIKWTQFNGRGERLYPGKEYCYVVDFVGNSILHGNPADERRWDLDGKEIEPEEKERVPFQVCYSCGVYNAPENDHCHWCGVELSDEARKANKNPRKLPAMIDGRMVAIDTDGMRQEIHTRAEEAKKEIAERDEIKRQEKESRMNGESLEMPSVEQRRSLIGKVFGDKLRRELFYESLEEI